jgi:hypothetical protein
MVSCGADKLIISGSTPKCHGSRTLLEKKTLENKTLENKTLEKKTLEEKTPKKKGRNADSYDWIIFGPFIAVLRIHDIFGWIRILLFSSLTFKMPAKN